ncbi:MAG: hypothetical protein WBN34_04510 [Woeseia sp.]
MHEPLPSTADALAATGKSVPDRASSLVRELQGLGFCPVLQRNACGPGTAGIGICMSVQTLQSCAMTRHWELQRVRALLFERCQVTLTLVDADTQPARQLEQVMRQLRRVSGAPCIDRRQLGLALPGRYLPLPAYHLMSRVWLGNGPRYVLLDEAGPDVNVALGAGRAVFSTLYQQRERQRALTPAYGSSLRSRCALLPDEPGVALCQPFAVLAPAASAWLPVSFNLCRFSDHRGRLRMAELFAALRRGLRLADSLLDELYWPDLRQRQDARENRRIAFLPEGIGDLVVLRRGDPSAIKCLRSLDQLLAAIHDCLWDESQQLACSRGVLPALAARNTLHKVPDAARQHWRQRWQEALAQVAVRHRNLLVLSPYSVLPQNGAAAAAFSDLLPLLAYADALCFACRPAFSGWRFDEFRAFHKRAAAVIRRRNAATFVATGV